MGVGGMGGGEAWGGRGGYAKAAVGFQSNEVMPRFVNTVYREYFHSQGQTGRGCGGSEKERQGEKERGLSGRERERGGGGGREGGEGQRKSERGEGEKEGGGGCQETKMRQRYRGRLRGMENERCKNNENGDWINTKRERERGSRADGDRNRDKRVAVKLRDSGYHLSVSDSVSDLPSCLSVQR